MAVVSSRVAAAQFFNGTVYSSYCGGTFGGTCEAEYGFDYFNGNYDIAIYGTCEVEEIEISYPAYYSGVSIDGTCSGNLSVDGEVMHDVGTADYYGDALFAETYLENALNDIFQSGAEDCIYESYELSNSGSLPCSD
jgi:hypothetical protein